MKNEGLTPRMTFQTLKYKDQFETPNAPVSHKTPEGYPLGEWQAHQRRAFNKGKLEKKRIKMLEEIGFKWKFKKRED